MNDVDLKKLTGRYEILSDYERVQKINSIEHHLSWTNLYSGMIHNASVYVPQANKIISSRNGLVDVNQEFMEYVIETINNYVYRIIEYDGKLYIIVPYSNISNEISTLQFLLYFEISEEWLNDQISNIGRINDSMVVLMKKDHQWIRFSNNQEYSESELYDLGDSLFDEKIQNNVILSDDGYIVHIDSSVLDLMIYAVIPNSIVLKKLSLYRNFVIVLAVLLLITISFYSYILYRNINKPIKLLVNGMREVEKGNLEVHIDHVRKDELGYLIKRFNSMCLRIKNMIEIVYEEKIHAKQAELRQLQYQINPHFLYNSLYMIRRMAVSNDCENIEKFAKYLGRYYEYITKEEHERTTLKLEIEHSMHYLGIQKMRFDDRVVTDIEEFKKKWTPITVPKLILQPLLENAFVHGVQKKRNSTIRIYYVEDDKYLEIHIFNNSDIDSEKIETINQKINKANVNESVLSGLENVHRRLQILFGKQCGVKLMKVIDGIDVSIKIKKRIEGELID